MKKIIATISGLAVLTAMFLTSVLFAGQSVSGNDAFDTGIQQDNSNKPKKEKKEKKNKKDKDSNMMMKNSNMDSNMMMNSNMDSNMMMNSNMSQNVNR